MRAAVRLLALAFVLARPQAEEVLDWDEEEPGGEDEAAAAYDCDEPSADHTSFAIAFEEAGDHEGATKAFEAAVRHNRNAHTLVNLGVFMMRRRRFLGKGEALDVMHQARTRHRTPESSKLVQENWEGLMQTMGALDIDVPERYRDKSRTGLAGLRSFSVPDPHWQAWFDGDEGQAELIARGIELDKAGDVVGAGRAFLGAVRTQTDAHSLVNLGVFMMRRRHFTEALKALCKSRDSVCPTISPAVVHSESEV